jgi:hypothetical protein
VKSERLARLVKLDRLQCSPAGFIGAVLVLFVIGVAAAHHGSPAPAVAPVAVPQHAAAAHSAHLAAGLIVAGIAAAAALTAAGIVRWLRCSTCWRPGTRVPPMRLDTATGTLQPIAAKTAESAKSSGLENADAPAESVTVADDTGTPVKISMDGVTRAGAK